MQVNRPSDKKLKEQLESWKSESGEGTDSVDGEDGNVFDRAVSRETIEMLDMEVQDLVVEIKKRGKVLTERPTMSSLRQYKQAMASFLKKSLSLSKEVQSLRGQRRSIQDIQEGREEKVHNIVVTIDDRLDDLTDSIVNKEQGRVEVTDMVDEIKGLVVDLVSEVQGQADEVR